MMIGSLFYTPTTAGFSLSGVSGILALLDLDRYRRVKDK
jgi:hypothetical protein